MAAGRPTSDAVLRLIAHLGGDVIELQAERSGRPLGPSLVLSAALTVDDHGDLRPARAADDPGQVLLEPLQRLGGPSPVVLAAHAVRPTGLAVTTIERAVGESASRWGRPDALELTVPARWSARSRQALAEAAAEAGWPEATIVPAPVASARRHLRGRSGLVIVLDVGTSVETTVVRLAGERAELLGVPLREAGIGAAHIDELLADEAVGAASPPLRDGLRSGGTGWLRASVVVRRIAADARRGALPAEGSTVATPAGRLDVAVPVGARERALTREADAIADQLWRTLRLAGVERPELDAVILSGSSRHDPGMADALRAVLGDLVVDGWRPPPATFAGEPGGMEPTVPLPRPRPDPERRRTRSPVATAPVAPPAGRRPAAGGPTSPSRACPTGPDRVPARRGRDHRLAARHRRLPGRHLPGPLRRRSPASAATVIRG